MCMIIDVNRMSDFINRKNKAMQPVHKWLEEKNGKLVYSEHESFKKELTQKQQKVLERYNQTGQARLVSDKQVEKEISDIRKKHHLKSNDIHILGLAKAAKVKILCSEDKALQKDFKDKDILGGKIYKNETHRRFLTKDACP